MITYQRVSNLLPNPPSERLIELYNEIDEKIINHSLCVEADAPLKHLYEIGNFCVSAASIQSKYVAFVLGKHVDTVFPEEIIQLFFNVENCYKMQFGKIKGKRIDGCICLIHQENKNFDLQKIYDSIYNI